MSNLIQTVFECPACARVLSFRKPAEAWEHGTHAQDMVTCRCGEQITVSVRITREEKP